MHNPAVFPVIETELKSLAGARLPGTAARLYTSSNLTRADYMGWVVRMLFCFGAATAPGWTQGVAQRPPYDTPEDAAQGGALFQTRCAFCHGPHGEGGRGADLTSGQYTHGGSDAELYATIRNGVPGTSMPSTGGTDEEVWKLVAFVKRIGSPGLYEQATGDAEAGKQIFLGKGRCFTCHSVATQGGSLGPDLTEVGKRRTLAYLEESIVAPDADVPIRYRAIQIVKKSGKAVSGVRLNEDDVSIQLRDGQNGLRSFMKDDLSEIRRDRKSIMPSYESVLTRKEIKDMVAYLHSLRGAE
jgi:putative heme-binding domain-containing protein